MTSALGLRRYPGEPRRREAVPLVLLHGWGNDSRCWEPLLPLLLREFDLVVADLPGFGQSPPCRSWSEAVEALAAGLPPKFSLLGWSLGGMLAVQLAHRFPQRVDQLVTIASNASFVNRSNWKSAMPVAVFDDFHRGFIADPGASINQFAALEARGDGEERKLLRWLRQHSAPVSPFNWLPGLEWLRQLDNREALSRLKTPSLHIFGEGDQLVPAAAAAKVAALSKRIQTCVLAGAGHAPQVSQPERIAALVREFLGVEPEEESAEGYHLRKRQIADSFSRAAAGYDAVAALQRQVGEELMALLPEGFEANRIADLGCGTGHFTTRLADRFADASCAGIDLSPGMVAYAAGQREESERLHWLCSDAEALALDDQQFDLVFSNFTFQWCQDLESLMAEQRRVLKPGGLLLFTTVGPHTLWQLREAWRQVDSYVHVNRFSPLDAVREAVAGQGLELLEWKEQTLTRHYPQLNGLTGELKALGAHNLNRGRNTGLTGRKQLLALKSAYESFRTREGLPADWEILYVVARRGDAAADS